MDSAPFGAASCAARPSVRGSFWPAPWPPGSSAHYATVYAKPAGRPQVDTFVTEVSQDTWIYLPWDTELQFVQPLVKGPEIE